MSIYLDSIHSGTLFAGIHQCIHQITGPIRAMSCSEKEGREENVKLIALAFCFFG